VTNGRIRRAIPDDVPEILAMVRELAEYEQAADQVVATVDQIRHALFVERPMVFAHVVEHDTGDGRHLAGFAMWFLNFSTWLGRHGLYLEDLYVRPEFRGSGYGRALLTTLARECVDRGYGRLEWWVLDWNEPALGFYRSLGALPMDEWTVHRVVGEELNRLAMGETR
jgi:GNAT superfamily N-acetyltransferase